MKDNNKQDDKSVFSVKFNSSDITALLAVSIGMAGLAIIMAGTMLLKPIIGILPYMHLTELLGLVAGASAGAVVGGLATACVALEVYCCYLQEQVDTASK